MELKDISKHRWITCENKDYIFNYAFKRRIKRSQQILQVNSPAFQAKLVKEGFGIALGFS